MNIFPLRKHSVEHNLDVNGVWRQWCALYSMPWQLMCLCLYARDRALLLSHLFIQNNFLLCNEVTQRAHKPPSNSASDQKIAFQPIEANDRESWKYPKSLSLSLLSEAVFFLHQFWIFEYIWWNYDDKKKISQCQKIRPFRLRLKIHTWLAYRTERPNRRKGKITASVRDKASFLNTLAHSQIKSRRKKRDIHFTLRLRRLLLSHRLRISNWRLCADADANDNRMRKN